MTSSFQSIGQVWQLHTDAELEKIDAAAVRLLQNAGCRVEHDGLLKLLEGAGCRVNWPRMRCFFPERLIRTAIEAISPKAGQAAEGRRSRETRQTLHLSGSHPHFLDWPSGARRLATKKDVENVAKMGHVLDEFSVVGRVLTCAEIDPRLEPLWTTLRLAEITDKLVGGGEILFDHYIDDLVRMGEVLTGKPGDTSLLVSCDFFVAPLIFEHNQAASFCRKRQLGMDNVPGSMPISGLSAPVTLAGTVAVAVAELLAGWVMGFLINPELKPSGVISTGSLDMRTASASFGSPEALLQDLTTVQVCRRVYGIPIVAATNYVDAKRPGIEAVYQKMYPLLSVPFGITWNIGADGLLSAGQDYSPVQQLLDLEIIQSINHFWDAFEVNDETLAAGLIESVIQEGTTDFLRQPHTLAHFKTEQWYPKWLDRTLWQGLPFESEFESKMLHRIDQYWKAAVARYQPPDIDPQKIQELRCIFKHAAARFELA